MGLEANRINRIVVTDMQQKKGIRKQQLSF